MSTHLFETTGEMRRSAIFSPDQRYRYTLRRWWDSASAPYVLWVMLNPSTADGAVDDPTIRRCIGFTKRWGFTRLEVVNLYAWRATNPRELPDDDATAVGPLNDYWIEAAAEHAALTIAAWGAKARPPREAWAAEHLPANTCVLAHLRSGSPQHPLYVLGSTTPRAWNRRAA